MFEFGAKLTLHDGMAGVMKKNIELQRQFREQLSRIERACDSWLRDTLREAIGALL